MLFRSITSCIYADDLLLLGEASEQEARTIMDTLHDFASVSGQKVGPEKSFVWFSREVSEQLKNQLTQLLQVPNNTTADKYLGNPIKPDKASFDFLIEKTSAKLQVWKAKLLTQAGRLVLIKAVLQAMPVYYMSTTVIPVSVIKALNALIRRFFWGSGDKARYLAYIAWDTICMPKEIGGLGVRDLKVVNEALIMKSLWKLLTNSPTPWVQLVLAKYLPRSYVWTSKRVYNCTVLWRALLNATEAMLSMIQWKLGDGLNCAVFGDPWFPGEIGRAHV